MLEDFKRKLRRAREDAGFSQEALANRLGVAHCTISNLERTTRVPYDDLLRAWAAYLRVPVPEGVHGRPRARCGTLGGVNKHRRNRTPLCRSCAAVRRAYHNAYQNQRRKQQ